MTPTLRRILLRQLLPIGIVYLAALLVARYAPVLPVWADHPVLRTIPAVVLAAAAMLGLLFMQTRITFAALLMITALQAAERTLGPPVDAAFRARLLLWAGMLIPVSLVIFHRLRERGIRSTYGILRVALCVLACGFLALLPQLAGETMARLAATPTAWAPVPGAVAISLLLCLPLLFLPVSFEGRALGPLMAASGICALTALTSHAAFWPTAHAAGVLRLFFSIAGMALLAAVLDSAWRKANMDELTQLPARHALKHHLASLGNTYTVGLIDIDHFKHINDRHGHTVGDQVLRFVASRLREHAPGRAYRYGGEEFVIICDGTGAQAHVAAIEAARQAIGLAPFRLRGKGRPRQRPEAPPPDARGRASALRITASAGVASTKDRAVDPQEVIKAADRALYRAKKQGRDRLCLAGRA